MTITLTKANGEKMELTIGQKTADRLIDAIYPPTMLGRADSKGYIALVNFIHVDSLNIPSLPQNVRDQMLFGNLCPNCREWHTKNVNCDGTPRESK